MGRTIKGEFQTKNHLNFLTIKTGQEWTESSDRDVPEPGWQNRTPVKDVP